MQPFKARCASHSHNPFTFLNTFRLDFLSKLATNAKKAELLCCFALFHFPFSVFGFFSSTPSGRSQVGVVRRANPLRYLSATICTGSTWVYGLSLTASAGTTGRLAPFNNSRWLSGIHACANGLHKIRRGCNRDCRRLQEMQQQQSVDCNRYLSCFSGELSLLFLASNSDMVGVPL